MMSLRQSHHLLFLCMNVQTSYTVGKLCMYEIMAMKRTHYKNFPVHLMLVLKSMANKNSVSYNYLTDSHCVKIAVLDDISDL